MFFADLSVLSHNGKKTHNILLFSLAITDLLTGWYLVFEMSLKIFYVVNSFIKVPRLIDIILTSWPEIAKQKYYLQDLQG